uniref:Uncharacterized protein n=1 Tax=Promethearchaeum syntrophicum TaxID=2594042 RepID=A0A5B9DBT9_9ARCH|nr:hypothetical protein DSAG12_02275 [Candidatus Prometheoarchaeum syntrophicum]
MPTQHFLDHLDKNLDKLQTILEEQLKKNQKLQEKFFK